MAITHNTIPISGPSGEPIEGSAIQIRQSVERYSDVELADGTVIRIKPSVTQVVRLKERWDDLGNPVYIVASQNIVVIEKIDEQLKRGREQ